MAQTSCGRSTAMVPSPESGACLDAQYGNSANGTLVQLWDCWGGPNQKWSYGLTGNDDFDGIGGKCLDAQGESSGAGTLVQLWDCWGGPNQKWTPKQRPSGVVPMADLDKPLPVTGTCKTSGPALPFAGTATISAGGSFYDVAVQAAIPNEVDSWYSLSRFHSARRGLRFRAVQRSRPEQHRPYRLFQSVQLDDRVALFRHICVLSGVRLATRGLGAGSL